MLFHHATLCRAVLLAAKKIRIVFIFKSRISRTVCSGGAVLARTFFKYQKIYLILKDLLVNSNSIKFNNCACVLQLSQLLTFQIKDLSYHYFHAVPDKSEYLEGSWIA